MNNDYLKITHRQALQILNTLHKYAVYIKHNDEYVGITVSDDDYIELEKRCRFLEDGLDELSYSTQVLYFTELHKFDLFINKRNKVFNKGLIEELE